MQAAEASITYRSTTDVQERHKQVPARMQCRNWSSGRIFLLGFICAHVLARGAAVVVHLGAVRAAHAVPAEMALVLRRRALRTASISKESVRTA